MAKFQVLWVSADWLPKRINASQNILPNYSVWGNFCKSKFFQSVLDCVFKPGVPGGQDLARQAFLHFFR